MERDTSAIGRPKWWNDPGIGGVTDRWNVASVSETELDVDRSRLRNTNEETGQRSMSRELVIIDETGIDGIEIIPSGIATKRVAAIPRNRSIDRIGAVLILRGVAFIRHGGMIISGGTAVSTAGMRRRRPLQPAI